MMVAAHGELVGDPLSAPRGKTVLAVVESGGRWELRRIEDVPDRCLRDPVLADTGALRGWMAGLAGSAAARKSEVTVTTMADGDRLHVAVEEPVVAECTACYAARGEWWLEDRLHVVSGCATVGADMEDRVKDSVKRIAAEHGLRKYSAEWISGAGWSRLDAGRAVIPEPAKPGQSETRPRMARLWAARVRRELLINAFLRVEAHQQLHTSLVRHRRDERAGAARYAARLEHAGRHEEQPPGTLYGTMAAANMTPASATTSPAAHGSGSPGRKTRSRAQPKLKGKSPLETWVTSRTGRARTDEPRGDASTRWIAESKKRDRARRQAARQRQTAASPSSTPKAERRVRPDTSSRASGAAAPRQGHTQDTTRIAPAPPAPVRPTVRGVRRKDERTARPRLPSQSSYAG